MKPKYALDDLQIRKQLRDWAASSLTEDPVVIVFTLGTLAIASKESQFGENLNHPDPTDTGMFGLNKRHFKNVIEEAIRRGIQRKWLKYAIISYNLLAIVDVAQVIALALYFTNFALTTNISEEKQATVAMIDSFQRYWYRPALFKIKGTRTISTQSKSDFTLRETMAEAVTDSQLSQETKQRLFSEIKNYDKEEIYDGHKTS